MHSPAQLRRLARGHFRGLLIAGLTSGVAWWASKSRLARLIKIRNLEIVDAVRARGDNIILLAPHFAALEHGGIFLSSLTPMISMYRAHKNPLLDAVIFKHRARFGIIQYAKNAPAKSMLRRLQNGHWFYYLPDQDPGKRQGVFAPFFGVQTATFASLGRIAAAGRAAVIPCVTVILPRGRGFEIVFAPPLRDFPGGDAVADATAMNRAVEELIAVAPAQYFWSHRRFKTRPEGEEGFYE